MKKKLLILLTGVLILLSGCTSSQNNIKIAEQKNQELQNSEWTLSKIDGELFRPFIVDGEVVGLSTISFDDKSFSGTTGVNRFNASYTIQKDKLISPMVASTRMGAINPMLADNEAKIFTILNSEDKKISFNDKNLTITSKNGTLFYKIANPLNHSSWKLKSMPDFDFATLQNNNKNLRVPTIEFDDDRVFGFAGVNSFSSNYNLAKDNITLGAVAATLMAGISQDANTLERDFFNNLNSIKNFSISENSELTLGGMTFKPVSYQQGTFNNNVWSLSKIGDEDISSILEKNKIVQGLTVEFKDNKISGFSGVNRFMGTYALKNRNIYISRLASTMMAGNKEMSEIEYKFTTALMNGEYFRLVNHETMVIYSDESSITLKRVFM